MVPLYGRGQSPSDQRALEGKALYQGMAIPPRPPACGTQALLSTSSSHSGQQLPYRNPYQSQHYNPHAYQEEDSSSPTLNLGITMTPGHHPVIGMFQGMIYAGVFGNSESLYAYPNSYHITGGSSPRLRRQEMQADKSLNRISIFLFCCFLLCLIVF
ncbi:E3 ubiquitin-protein ligase RMA1H1-like [Quillaja saponaria]|uniref:E3 ubiquitin-protein ligase RMA n=1 Tax=Quillaja saponaria TaxID=32244 RepID=A0AAD7M2P0_QUISA|nr:E3 ubiquitin-protein ligase RMA1H1-like [Quillaja saponaria]